MLKIFHAAAGALRSQVRMVEEWWFDATRGLETSKIVSLREAGPLLADARDSVNYIPARVANVRAVLQEMPVTDHSAYTFVDLGSGKGRILFLAAEYPFQRVLGVEFSTSLHQRAVANIARCRQQQQCRVIESVLVDAAEYQFPPGNLVLYLFNPFGAETMKRVLANLSRSLQQSPRHVVVLLLWPQNGNMVAQVQSMQLFRATRRYQIYESRR